MVDGIRSHGLLAAGWNASPVRAGVTDVKRDVSASLSVTTRDGDTFSLSASLDTEAAYAGVRTNGLRVGAWSVSASRSYSIQMNGSFDAQELKDISRVVRTFLHDLRALASGHDASVADVASGHPASLASVSATAQSSTTVTMAAVAGTPQAAPPEADGPVAGALPRGGLVQPEPVPAAIAPAPSGLPAGSGLL